MVTGAVAVPRPGAARARTTSPRSSCSSPTATGRKPSTFCGATSTVRAERITGWARSCRTVLGEVVYADPTSIENNILVLGGQPKAPPQPAAETRGACEARGSAGD